MTTSPLRPSRGRVALTLGDPRGIGPAVCFEAVSLLRDELHAADMLFVVPEEMAARAASWGAVHAIPAWDGTAADAGRVSVEAIETAVELAKEGTVGAIMTGPVHKPSLHTAGWHVPGQTEMLQALTGAPRVGMLMDAEDTPSGGALRVLLATTHIPLRDVPTAVTEDLLWEQASLLDGALRSDWGMPSPRIAFCALNPHASDQGLFGDEEARIFAPALARLRAAGLTVSDPLPADTVFRRALGGEFDAVVAPYHDVGMAGFKTAAFGCGVNVTLGLPFIRTSPDHGTAFDLVEKGGHADPSSTVEALRLARRLALARFDTGRCDV